MSTLSRSSSCAAMLPPIMIGIASKVMRKALDRTAAWYSREATTNILRMRQLPHGGSRNAQEDVVQRRARDLEVPHPAALHQRGEHGLRIGVARDAQFLQPAVIVHVFHARDAGKIGRVPFQPHAQD